MCVDCVVVNIRLLGDDDGVALCWRWEMFPNEVFRKVVKSVRYALKLERFHN